MVSVHGLVYLCLSGGIVDLNNDQN
jgi:hypothetical protein